MKSTNSDFSVNPNSVNSERKRIEMRSLYPGRVVQSAHNNQSPFFGKIEKYGAQQKIN